MAQNKSEIKELQREVRQLSTAMQLLAREIQYSRETDRLERDKFRLQIENDLLKRLPPPKDE